MERIKDYKSTFLRSIFALHLATSAVQPPESEIINPEPIICTADDINERYGIRLVDRVDMDLSGKFAAYNFRFIEPNLDASPEMICAVEEALGRLPNPSFYIQNVIFFPEFFLSGDGSYLNDPFDEGENWMIIHYLEDVSLWDDFSERQLSSNVRAPDYYSYIQHIVVHEAGHALVDTITFVASPNEESYKQRYERYNFDRDNPIFRTFAEVGGFEFIEPKENCVMDTCLNPGSYRMVEVNGLLLYLRGAGWIRTAEFLERGQISQYEQRSNDIHEAIAEYLRGYIFEPGILDENQIRYFDNLLSGLSSEDAYKFLHLLVSYPEETLLK